MLNVYLDTENVAGADMAGANLLPEAANIYVYLRAGASKPKRLLQALGKMRGSIVEREVIGSTPNAMDFQIVWDVSQAIHESPKSMNIIISKDSGYTAILTRAFIEGNMLRMIPDLSEVSVLKIMNNVNVLIPEISMADYLEWYSREREKENE